MCEHAGKLVGWIDGEVSAADASEIARHVAECAECRNCAAELRSASGEFAGFCDAIFHEGARRETRSWKSAVLAAAAAIIFALAVAHWRRPVVPPAQPPGEAASAINNPLRVQSAVAKASGSENRDANRHHHQSAPAAAALQARAQTQSERSASHEPALRIAIPAEAIFAPGALPDGMIFVADLSIGADGRVEQLRLVPQPVPLEGRLEK